MAEPEKVTVNDVIEAVSGFFGSIGTAARALLRSVGEMDIATIWRYFVLAFALVSVIVIIVGTWLMLVRGVAGLIRRWRRDA